MNTIINFHEVKDIRWFEMVINILKKKYLLVSLDEIESFYYDKKDLKNSCHITIDDGDRTFYDIIYKILIKHKINATLFVSPSIILEGGNYWFQEISGYDEEKMKSIIAGHFRIEKNILKYPVKTILKNIKIDDIWQIIHSYQRKYNIKKKDNLNINIDQLIEIERFGLVSIGAHTLNHPILANEDYARSKKEIFESFIRLNEILGHSVKSFAFPNGIPLIDYNEREYNILKENNCRLAFSTELKNFTRMDNPLNIPRSAFNFGPELYIKTKLFIGDHWEDIINTRRKNEIKNRYDLKRLISI